MLDRDWLDGLDSAIEYLTGEYDEGFPLVVKLIKLRALLSAPEPPSAPAPRECGYGKLGVEDGEERAHKIWAVNFKFCPDCGAALDDKGER